MRRVALLGAILFGAGMANGEPSVAIAGVKYRAWTNLIDVVYSLTVDRGHDYGLDLLFVDGAVTNRVRTDQIVKASYKVGSFVGACTVDAGRDAPDFADAAAHPDFSVIGLLVDRGRKDDDPEALDKGDGVTFVPGDYLVLDLSTGETREMPGVKHPETFNVPRYQTYHMAFRRIPAGSFMMGAASNRSGVKVTHFGEYYIAVFPCTRVQWQTVLGKKVAAKPDTRPASDISWNQIGGCLTTDLLPVLNRKVLGYRVELPTEVQWERAARAGSRTARFFDIVLAKGAAKAADYAIYESWFTEKVGKVRPNAWGLYDVYGNVWECCRDWYSEKPNYIRNPQGPERGALRVMRGGCCVSEERICTSLGRQSCDPSLSGAALGFRLVLEPEAD